MIEIALCFVILYLVLIYYVNKICCTTKRTLTRSSDVETQEPVLLQVNTEDTPNNTLPYGVKSQISEDKVNQIEEEQLDDNNNSAFPVTTPLRNGPCFEPFFKDYAGNPRYWYRSSFHNLIDIDNV